MGPVRLVKVGVMVWPSGSLHLTVRLVALAVAIKSAVLLGEAVAVYSLPAALVAALGVILS